MYTSLVPDKDRPTTTVREYNFKANVVTNSGYGKETTISVTFHDGELINVQIEGLDSSTIPEEERWRVKGEIAKRVESLKDFETNIMSEIRKHKEPSYDRLPT